jgi:hypothetical protein
MTAMASFPRIVLARHFLIHLASSPWQTPSSGNEQWSIKVSEGICDGGSVKLASKLLLLCRQCL